MSHLISLSCRITLLEKYCMINKCNEKETAGRVMIVTRVLRNLLYNYIIKRLSGIL